MLKRVVYLTYERENFQYTVEEKNDFKATLKAIHILEKQLGIIYGGLVKFFKDNPDNIIVKIY